MNRKGGVEIRKIMLYVFGVLIFIINNSFVFAETLILKSGQTLEGKITEKTDKYIIINFEGISIHYDVDDIASIAGEEVSATIGRVASKSTTNVSNLKKYTTELDQCILNEKYEEAILLIKKMILLESNDSDLYKGLGILYYYAGHPEESISVFQKVLNFAPKDLKILLYLSIVYDSIGEYEKAKRGLPNA